MPAMEERSEAPESQGTGKLMGKQETCQSEQTEILNQWGKKKMRRNGVYTEKFPKIQWSVTASSRNKNIR